MTLDFQSVEVGKRKTAEAALPQRSPAAYVFGVLAAVVAALGAMSLLWA